MTADHAQSSLDASPSRLRELASIFFKLGAISFGGPAAHIALMEREFVGKRQWVTKQQFLDMLGAANLVPGPTSTELAINIGFTRAGWAGLCVAGSAFILPAALITGVVAWAYVRYGALPQAATLLAGIKAAVIAVIAIAIFRLGKSAAKNVALGSLGAAAAAAFFLHVNPLLILFGGGVLGLIALEASQMRATALALAPSVRFWAVAGLASAAVPDASRPSIGRIALFFLKVGALLYGGGYVLLAFLEDGLTRQHPWLTHQQLLDSVAIGQFTPGPVFSTATFIGYLLGGVPGSIVATVGIFLPSFFYVALLAPVLFRLRQSRWMGSFLDSVNVCAVALMAGVTVLLARDALGNWTSAAIGAVALGILLRWKVNPAWVVLGGGLARLLMGLVH